MSPALSALFSFRRAAGEVMCASQIFMEDPGRLSLTVPRREREMDSSNVALMKILPLIFLWVTISDFPVVNEDLIGTFICCIEYNWKKIDYNIISSVSVFVTVYTYLNCPKVPDNGFSLTLF